ncbi:MAG TPA: hypothetical protein VG474_14340 [Solirubrobacteraceae bacterium]|nr:hypothetical protein [Solirubrobacteraceae bacterium]
MRIKGMYGVVLVALAAALVACGGSNDDKADKPPSAADARKLLQQTFGPNPNASSGKLDGSVTIRVEGVRRFAEPVTLRASGPFNQSGDAPPEANLSVGLRLGSSAIGGELILIDDEALIGLGDTAYRIPDSIAATIRRPLRNSDNALTSVLAVFGIAPQRWAENPRIVGNETVGGVETVHATAELDRQRFFLDVARLTKVLTSLRITEVTGLPRDVDRRARVALSRSVKSATGHIWSGAEDHVLRKASFSMTIEPSAAERRTLGGISSMKVNGQLEVTEVGTEQRVEPPRNRGSYRALQTTLDALADAARR